MAIKNIVTNIKELRKPCALVEKGEDIKSIIKDLEDTLEKHGGFGLAANQIGISKQIAIVRIKDPKTGQLRAKEDLINPKIIEKGQRIKVSEECLSFPHLPPIEVDRHVFIQVEDMSNKPVIFVGIDSCVVEHEIHHLWGITLLDDKHKDVNRRKR